MLQTPRLARPLGVEERQLPAPRVRPSRREVRLVRDRRACPDAVRRTRRSARGQRPRKQRDRESSAAPRHVIDRDLSCRNARRARARAPHVRGARASLGAIYRVRPASRARPRSGLSRAASCEPGSPCGPSSCALRSGLLRLRRPCGRGLRVTVCLAGRSSVFAAVVFFASAPLRGRSLRGRPSSRGRLLAGGRLLLRRRLPRSGLASRSIFFGGRLLAGGRLPRRRRLPRAVVFRVAVVFRAAVFERVFRAVVFRAVVLRAVVLRRRRLLRSCLLLRSRPSLGGRLLRRRRLLGGCCWLKLVAESTPGRAVSRSATRPRRRRNGACDLCNLARSRRSRLGPRLVGGSRAIGSLHEPAFDVS